MGIDINTHWKGQTLAERRRQIAAFSTVPGHVGYLREASHGGPYATEYLLREAFESETSSAAIPAALLRKRLPETLAIVEERQRKIYNVTKAEAIDEVLQSFRDFVALCEEKERETGEPVVINASY